MFSRSNEPFILRFKPTLDMSLRWGQRHCERGAEVGDGREKKRKGNSKKVIAFKKRISVMGFVDDGLMVFIDFGPCGDVGNQWQVDRTMAKTT